MIDTARSPPDGASVRARREQQIVRPAPDRRLSCGGGNQKAVYSGSRTAHSGGAHVRRVPREIGLRGEVAQWSKPSDHQSFQQPSEPASFVEGPHFLDLVP